MSGTSVDSVDGALIRIDNGDLSLLQTSSIDTPDAIRNEAIDLIRSDRQSLDRAWRLGNKMAEIFADAAHPLIEAGKGEVDAIGCHGQTLRHFPNDPQSPFSVQVVNGAMLAIRTGLPCITDFRSADMALGGQGAPLASGLHANCFRSPAIDRVIVNIGGIANVTSLPADSEGSIIGFDTGPGNGLMDEWAFRHIGTRYDADGAWAASGICSDTLLARMLTDSYFTRSAPKSTGREYFNISWLDKHVAPMGELDAADVQATLVELTATTIANSIGNLFNSKPGVLVCGGGYRNKMLMKRLAARLGVNTIANTSALGIPPEWVECVTFAWLAHQRMSGLPGNVPSVTGARRAAILGALYLP